MPISATYHDIRAADRTGRYIDVLPGQQGDAITVANGAASAPLTATGLYRIHAEGDIRLRFGIGVTSAAGGEIWPDGRTEARYIKAGETIAVAAL